MENLDKTIYPYAITDNLYKKYSNSSPCPPLADLVALQVELAAFRESSVQRSTTYSKNQNVVQNYLKSGLPSSVATPIKNDEKPPISETKPRPSSASQEKKRKISKVEEEEIVESVPIVNGDYSKVRVTNQIPLAQFYSYMDQFFRNITDDDLNFLNSNGDEVSPFMIPPLGKHYSKQWANEDGFFGTENKGEYFNVDDTTYPGDLPFGSLYSRVTAALIQDEAIPYDDTSESETIVEEVRKDRTKSQMQEIEDRILLELSYLGLVPPPALGDDEITQELREAQAALRSQMEVNKKRKQILLKRAKEHIGWQEYNTLLDEENKKVENAYNRKFRKAPKKKRFGVFIKEVIQPEEDIQKILDNRKKLISGVLSEIFRKEKFTMPSRSIYSDN